METTQIRIYKILQTQFSKKDSETLVSEIQNLHEIGLIEKIGVMLSQAEARIVIDVKKELIEEIDERFSQSEARFSQPEVKISEVKTQISQSQARIIGEMHRAINSMMWKVLAIAGGQLALLLAGLKLFG